MCSPVRFIENEREAEIRAKLDHLGIPSVASTALAWTFPVGRVRLDLDWETLPTKSLSPFVSVSVRPSRAVAVNDRENFSGFHSHGESRFQC